MATKQKKKSSKKKKGKVNKKGILIGLLIFSAVLLTVGGFGLYMFKKDAVKMKAKSTYLYIPTNATINNVVDSLKTHNYVQDTSYFRWLANKMKYSSNVRAGRYKITKGMSLYSLITMLKSGQQEPLMLTIQKSRTKADFASKIIKKLEVDSLELINLLNNDAYLEQYGLASETALTLMIPNTYEFYWNTSADKFMSRMAKENRKFWNDSRMQKAKTIGLTPAEVVILASIVDEETNRNDEKATVASVYLNRLRIGMLLQADPTARFAAADFGAQRIKGRHQIADSPYNTYVFAGLPPGPICIPSISSIEAVLANKQTNYLYFCANADFSGYHCFTPSYSVHLDNAAKFHRELDRRGIK